MVTQARALPPLVARNEATELIQHFHREDERRWVPLMEGASFYPFSFDVQHSAWHGVFRVQPGANIPAHYHGGRVVGCTLRGRWRYRGRDWVHAPGSYLLEVPGDMHTFEVVGDEVVELFVMNEGSLLAVDEAGAVTAIADVIVRLEQTRKHYSEQGFEPEVIEALIR
ncbi:2,4'-dihydroxyacetophenone dioxygenase family protein [Pollutimonas bauzanensis]|uniref:2,4'-dihydroxyacetophenone dioxygenase family protein n=1 Tax=Pollutimonas bauzanensis TaxID=658167 RepID=UPI003340F9EB